jgi:N-formylglutamate amidohydrolase
VGGSPAAWQDELVTRTPLAPPLLLPSSGGLPVLLSVPHSGRDYPAWLIKEARRGLRSLEPLEDPLVDRLVSRATALGVGAVVARAPRAAIDCNRSSDEIDPATVGMPPEGDPGPRARGGLGLIPGRTPQNGELWRSKLSMAEIERRKAEAWSPYHRGVEEALAKLHARFGEVLLLDCHSMPPRGTGLPNFVLGDRHGRTAGRWLGDLARRTIEEAGHRAAFNDPYAGGWIVEHHGDPSTGIHALQLEVDRSAYLAPDLRRPGAAFAGIAELIQTLVRTLGEALLDRAALPAAAE